MEIPKLGHINFLNCLPLTYSLKYDGFDQGLAVSSDVPAVLNENIIQNRLDVSPVSSIIYARNNEKLLLMPDVSITADGNVQSIILVSKKPIEKLSSDKILLTAKSATSHCLLKIILHKAYGANPQYYIRTIDMNTVLVRDITAKLLIGDDALYAKYHQQPGLYYYDIGLQWKKLTGLRMVYAVWVVNREFAKKRPDLVQYTYEKVTQGFKNGYAKKRQAIASVLDTKPFSFTQLDEYLDVIKWDLGQEHLKALLTFYTLAHELNLIDHVPKFELAKISKPSKK
jgi:chorismate dehydratase